MLTDFFHHGLFLFSNVDNVPHIPQFDGLACSLFLGLIQSSTGPKGVVRRKVARNTESNEGGVLGGLRSSASMFQISGDSTGLKVFVHSHWNNTR